MLTLLGNWWSWCVESIKGIMTCLTFFGMCGTGYVYLDGPLPISKQQVIAQVNPLNDRLIDLQLLSLDSKKSSLKGEKLQKEIEISKPTIDMTDKIKAQNRLDEIKDELKDVEDARKDLMGQKSRK